MILADAAPDIVKTDGQYYQGRCVPRRRSFFTALNPLGLTFAQDRSEVIEMASTMYSAIVDQLLSDPGSCRLWSEQTEGPYHRDLHPERRDITEGRPGAPLGVGLRLFDSSGAPMADTLVEVWQADHEGRYSGFRPFVPEPGQVVTSDSVPHDVIAPKESFLRGAQRTDDRGICSFDTIFPGWYSSRTVHIHVIVHLAGGWLTTQLYFPDELTNRVFAIPPYRDRPPRDTTNGTDTIFVDGGEQTVLSISGDPASALIGTLCVSIQDTRER